VIWLGWVLFLMWVSSVKGVAPMIRDRHLERLAGTEAPEGGFPLLSVVVPARDEEADIENCLRSILASDYPHLELIAVNDRSADQTSAIIDRIVKQDSRVRPVHIETLPDGWLGKNHALQTGADLAQGEYLLFTDGDILFEPDCLKRAANFMRESEVDHLALIPGGLEGGAVETTFKTFFLFGYIQFIRNLEPIADGQYSYFGFGAFNMVTRKAYEAIGGHASFKMDVVDDLILGKRFKDTGHRQELLFARESLSLHWYQGVDACIRGLEKNMFASFEYSWGKTAFGLFMFFFFYLLGYAGLLLFPDPAAYGFFASLVLMHGLFAYLAKDYGVKWWHHVWVPLAVILEMYAVVRSCWKTWRQGGVYWRDTFYSLDTLKRERYRTPPGS
jgi:glycosyltransferase involved in cell wall biosynthesis